MKPETRALLEAAAPMLDRQIEVAVREAVDERLGIPRVTVEEVARPILESVAVVHAEDLANAEEDLPAWLEAEFAGHIEIGLLRQVVDDTLTADAGAHAAGLRLLETALRGALASAPAVRERRVQTLLEAERSRLVRRERSRPARAVSTLRALVTLPDEALDAPARVGA